MHVVHGAADELALDELLRELLALLDAPPSCGVVASDPPSAG